MKMTTRPTVMQRKPEREEGKARKKPVIGLGVITEKVAKKTRYAKSDVCNVLRAVLELVANETVKGNTVRLPGLGTLTLIGRAERVIKPFGKERMVVPAHKTVKFKPASYLKNALNAAKK
ncbi:MAG: DNA-binding protein HU [Pelotomaculum sp. PtaU1.Bin065]|nr:MAG: DNA-binding protein HU [Pelotomaculum sp. PtaU1.Bin065]